MNSTTHHTPGPWTVNGPWHIQADTTLEEFQAGGSRPKVVAHIVQGHNITPEQRKANATLIAAAPELLEALEQVELYLDSIDSAEIAQSIGMVVRGAIAKAKQVPQ